MYNQIIRELALPAQYLDIVVKDLPTSQSFHNVYDHSRREFRGDRINPTLDRSLAISWHDRVIHIMREVESCKAVQSAYEEHVARYGYSLYDLKIVEQIIAW